MQILLVTGETPNEINSVKVDSGKVQIHIDVVAVSRIFSSIGFGVGYNVSQENQGQRIVRVGIVLHYSLVIVLVILAIYGDLISNYVSRFEAIDVDIVDLDQRIQGTAIEIAEVILIETPVHFSVRVHVRMQKGIPVRMVVS